jgi:hypothetical protein
MAAFLGLNPQKTLTNLRILTLTLYQQFGDH